MAGTTKQKKTGLMDNTDLKILDMLQNHGRIPNTEIAKQLGMAPSGILERIRKLERKGILQGYHAKVNEKMVGYGLLAFVWIKLDQGNWEDEVGKALADITGVLEVYEVAGEYSYLVKVRCENMEDLSQLLKTQFAQLSHVSMTQSTLVFSTVKDNPALPLEKKNQ